MLRIQCFHEPIPPWKSTRSGPRPRRCTASRGGVALTSQATAGRTRFDSRQVSGGGTLLGDLAALSCRIRLLWGERDDSAFRPANLLIGEIRGAGVSDIHRIPSAGHWSAYENAPEVNRLLLEFFSS